MEGKKLGKLQDGTPRKLNRVRPVFEKACITSYVHTYVSIASIPSVIQ